MQILIAIYILFVSGAVYTGVCTFPEAQVSAADGSEG